MEFPKPNEEPIGQVIHQSGYRSPRGRTNRLGVHHPQPRVLNPQVIAGKNYRVLTGSVIIFSPPPCSPFPLTLNPVKCTVRLLNKGVWGKITN